MDNKIRNAIDEFKHSVKNILSVNKQVHVHEYAPQIIPTSDLNLAEIDIVFYEKLIPIIPTIASLGINMQNILKVRLYFDARSDQHKYGIGSICFKIAAAHTKAIGTVYHTIKENQLRHLAKEIHARETDF